jgi:hypothetical protein
MNANRIRRASPTPMCIGMAASSTGTRTCRTRIISIITDVVGESADRYRHGHTSRKLACALTAMSSFHRSG